MTAEVGPGSTLWREVGVSVLFTVGFVVLFVGVPPVPLCAVGACVLNPRPEAFLLAAALPFGAAAILGVSLGGLLGPLIYEAIHPTGTTTLDAAMAAIAFLVATWSGRWMLRRFPSWPGAVVATAVLTAVVTAVLGTYFYGLRGIGLPGAYTNVLGEAFIPINIVGALFLALLPLWKRERERQSAAGQDGG